ncbi:MAG: hypothetical protein WCS85_04675 [Candidatus Peribacteraceae bacterium]
MSVEGALHHLGHAITAPVLHGWSILEIGLGAGLLYIGAKMVGSMVSNTRSRVRSALNDMTGF